MCVLYDLLGQIWFLEIRFRPGWPRTLRNPTASASLVMGLKACATTPSIKK